MYVKSLSLRNIKGFQELDFDLTRPDQSYSGWTVFTGDNGAGKSTLLKAIALALVGKDTARALQPTFNGWIRQTAAGRSTIEVEVVRIDADDALSTKGNAPVKPFPAKLEFVNSGKEVELAAIAPGVKKDKYKTPERSIWALDASGWFCCGYGPFRRVFGASPDAMQQMVSPTTSRFATMFQEAASLAQADRWLRDLNYKKLENKQSEREQLELLLELLGQELMPSGLKVDRVDSEGLWLTDHNNVQLAWTEMSDGYRAALALLTDIIRHLANTYGVTGLFDRDADGKLACQRSGVVLIDEIDAHLHPEWQREIGFWLKRHFPKIQFLVTTHSPIICQAADPNGLFVLPEPSTGNKPAAISDEDYRRIIAARPDTILLTPAFGLQNTRSPRAVEGRRRYAELQAKQRSGTALNAQEKKERQQLELFAAADEEA